MNQISSQAVSTPRGRVLFIDDSHATAAETRQWVKRLRGAGLNTTVLHPAQAVKQAEAAAGRLLAIGKGTGAETAYRLLTAEQVRAAVLLSPAFAPVHHEHGPLLLINTTDSIDVIAETLRTDGICDQHLMNVTPDTLTTGETGTDVAHYIRSWLDFHQLLSQGN